MKKEYQIKGEELLKKVKHIISEGNVRKIVIKNEKGQTYLEIPVTIGVIGAVIAPMLTAIGALAAMANNFTVEVIKKDDRKQASVKVKKPAKKKAPKKPAKKVTKKTTASRKKKK